VTIRAVIPDTSANARAAVVWPKSERPLRAVARPKVDTIGGVISGNALVVSAFARRWTFPSDSIRDAEVVARWVDGEPAAVEVREASGCSRSVAIPVTSVGDLVIRPDFVRFTSALSGQCSAGAALRPADPQVVTNLAGSGGLASQESFSARGDVRSELARWLLALAIALAVAELLVRRRKTSMTAAARTSAMERAA
jgi:hypothetical protein